MSDQTDYETDVVKWSEHQADLLRRRATNEIDWDNVAEEIEDVARRRRDQIENRLIVICAHLLKWRFQPDIRSTGWRGSIVEGRNRIARLTRKMPTLDPYPATVLADVYPDARRQAEAETGLTGLPEVCPWTIEQVLDHDFLPPDGPG